MTVDSRTKVGSFVSVSDSSMFVKSPLRLTDLGQEGGE